MLTDQPLNLSTHQLTNYILHLADNSLIMGHRLSEWTGHGPVLEQDIAISNIALDLIGQSRNFYQYAALLKNDGSTEDTLAYLRDANEFRNIILVEQPRGDWAWSVLKVFFFSAYQYYLYNQLLHLEDRQLAAIAEKSLKEVTYHLRWSSEWVVRLGDGTEESRRRMNTALDGLWPYTNEMFQPTEWEMAAASSGTAVDVRTIQNDWNEKVRSVLAEATLKVPAMIDDTAMPGKRGEHTEHLTEVLTDLQYLQRTYPGCEW